ncbi:MAG: thioesterase [candidate division NC10 bacterium]|nr:thioesterase [candidate division NC10 bacterium]
MWREDFRIRSHEVDATGKASLPALCLLMQEAAWNHARRLQFGYADLTARGLLWVLSRMLIWIDRYPAWEEQIQVHTWPSGANRLFAQRDFEIRDQHGKAIAAATGDWLILNAKSRRPQRVEAFFGERIHTLPSRRALQERPGRIPALQPSEGTTFFPVRFSDLDLQGHVNHAKYIEWILDSYPRQMHERQRVSLLEIHFLAESTLGDEVSVRNQRIEGPPSCHLHSLLRRRDEKEVCRARTIWSERSPR